MKTAIVVKQAGKIISEDHLNKIFHGLNPTCLGIVANAFGENDMPLLAVEHMPVLAELGKTWKEIHDELLTYQDVLKENQAIFVFSDATGEVKTGSDGDLETFGMQPYVLIQDDNGFVHLAVAISGDYSAFGKKDSKHPPEFFAVKEEILPRIQNIFDLTGHDVEKTLTSLRSGGLFTKDMQKLSSDGAGLITFMASDGQLLTIPQKDGLTTEQPFGWSSFVGETSAIPQTKEGKGLLGKFQQLRKKGTGVPQNVADTKVEPKLDPPAEVPKEPVKTVEEPKKADTAVASVSPKKTVKAPAHISTKNEIRDWYKKHAGFVPEGYKNKPVVEVRDPVVDPKDLKQLDKVVEKKKLERLGPSVPIIPAEMRDEITKDAVVLKILDNSGVVPTKEQLDEIESKFSSFTEQLGGEMELRKLTLWSFDDIKQFTAKYKDAGDVLIQTLLWSYARNLGVAEPQKKVEAPTAEKTPAEAAPSPASPKFSFKRKQAA